MDEVISQPGGSGTKKDATAKTQQDDRHQPGFEPTEDEKAAVKVWIDRIQRAETNPAFKQWVDLLAELRGYVAGTKHDDKTNKTLVRTNMVYATIAAMIPEIYAKNPDIGVTPTDAVPQANMANVKKFAETAEKVLHKMLVEEGRLKKRAKANIRATSATSIGVLKMVYQKEYRGDPLIIRRIEDTQDNLAKIETLVRSLKKEDDPVLVAKQRDELRANLKALHAGKEVRIFKGFVVDRMKSEDFLIMDDSVVEFDEYVDASALGQRTWLTVDKAEQLFRMKMEGATRYGRPRTDDKTAQSNNPNADTTAPGDMFVCAVEVWDKENGVVRTVVKGMNRWVREPYAPQNVSQRWYPYFVLGFNPIEGRWRPISDVELLMGLQDEYNTTRTNYADIREKAVPKRIIRKGGNLSEEDVKHVVESGNKDWVAVEGNPAMPITQDIMDLPGQKIDPQAYDTTIINRDMDLVAGRSDASRAALIKPKTATEAEIMQEAMSTRTAERRDTNEDLMSDMGAAALEIALNDLTKDDVIMLAGADCEWPQAPESVESIFRQVVVRVRAGSTGKPNQAKEREQWGQLLPQIAEAMKQVNDLRMAGNFEMADAVVQLLRETLRRFDEHLDLDAIIPPVEKGPDGQPMQQAAMLTQMQQELAQCKEDLAKCQDELNKAKAQESVKVREAELSAEQDAREALLKANDQAADTQRQHELKLAQEASKAEAEKTKQADLEKKDALERSRMDKEFDLKQKQIAADKAAAVEIARINAEAKKEGAGGENALPSVEQSLSGLMQEFEGFLSADRVPEYGPNGMPSRVRLVRKDKPDLQAELDGLAQEMREFIDADRVPEFGPNGMPARIRIVKKAKAAAQ